MTIVIPALALIVLIGVLLYACRREPEPQQPEPDSFDVELYGRWPADHKFVKQ